MSLAIDSIVHRWNSLYSEIRRELVPELCRFLGIVIAMYYRDHAPPHFHAIYREYEVTVEIGSGLVRGSMPVRALELIQKLRILHQVELSQAWTLAQNHLPLPNIAPLD
jgi:Domain of unknown function (DUF4160)